MSTPLEPFRRVTAASRNASPRVSIVTATRNRPELLLRALKSIRRQTLRNFESIVVDDGSRPEVFETYRHLWASELDERFMLCEPVAPNTPGSGPAGARNRGIQEARGDYVAFLDDDDVWVQDSYLEVATNLMDERGANYFFGHLEGVREDRFMNPGWVPAPVSLYKPQQIHNLPAVYWIPRRDLIHLAQRFLIHPCNSIVRRTILSDIGGFLEYLRHSSEDTNLMLRIIDRINGALYRSECVTHYRLPTNDAEQAISSSLTRDYLTHKLSNITCMHHLRIRSISDEMRRCARAKEAWAYREISDYMARQGDFKSARIYARQALCTFATLGGGSAFSRFFS